jgi:hypothetical protein
VFYNSETIRYVCLLLLLYFWILYEVEINGEFFILTVLEYDCISWQAKGIWYYYNIVGFYRLYRTWLFYFCLFLSIYINFNWPIQTSNDWRVPYFFLNHWIRYHCAFICIYDSLDFDWCFCESIGFHRIFFFSINKDDRLTK